MHTPINTHTPSMHTDLSHCPYTHISNTPNAYTFCAQNHPPYAPIFSSPAPTGTSASHTLAHASAPHCTHIFCTHQHSTHIVPTPHLSYTHTYTHTNAHTLPPATHIPNSHLHKHSTPQQSKLKSVGGSQPRALESEACSSAWTFSHTRTLLSTHGGGQGSCQISSEESQVKRPAC